MRGLTIIIPSRTPNNLISAIDAIRSNGETARVIVVEDWRTPEDQSKARLGVSGWFKYPVGFHVGVKPFCFARNVNIGIRAAGDDDVVILNDDALLKTPEGFTAMQRIARENPEYGVISAATNNVGNLNQRPRGGGLREEPRMVCFIAALVTREARTVAGLLDERFIHYGLDDDDYCLRVRRAGLKIGIFDGCEVDHSKLPSAYRGTGCGNFRPNLALFIQKWGVDNRGCGRADSQFPECFPEI